MIGDAYPTPRPDVYDFDDCDEMTLCSLATLDELRRRFVDRDGGYPSGKANTALIDTYAREIVDSSRDEEGDNL